MPLAVYPKCFLKALVVDRTMTLNDWIGLVRRDLDVDGLEFHLGFTPSSRADRLRLRQSLEEQSLSVPMMCYAPDFIHRDARRRELEMAGQKRAIEATADLGGRFCRVLSGQWKPGVTREDGLAMAAEAIRACLPVATRHGICLILENHYKAT